MSALKFLISKGIIVPPCKDWIVSYPSGREFNIGDLMEEYHLQQLKDLNDSGARIEPGEKILQPWHQGMSAKEFIIREGMDPNGHIHSPNGNISFPSILETFASIKVREERARTKSLPVLTAPKPIFHAVLCTAHGNTPETVAAYAEKCKSMEGDYHVIVHLDNSIGNKFQILSPGHDQPTGILTMDPLVRTKPLTEDEKEEIKKRFKDHFASRTVGTYKAKIEKALEDQVKARITKEIIDNSTFVQALNMRWCTSFNKYKIVKFGKLIIEGVKFKDAYSQTFKYFKS